MKLSEIIIVALLLSVLSGCNEHNTIAIYNNDSNDCCFDFRWADPNTPYLKRFREECELDEIIFRCKTDIEKAEKLCRWTHGLWNHNGGNKPAKNDPLSIVKEARLGRNFRCVEYAKVLNASLNSIGIPARVIGLKTKDVETRSSGAGHIGTEAYISSLSKWVFIDAQWDAIPYYGKTPLNAIEFQNALFQKNTNVNIHSNSTLTKLFYSKWVSKYLFYIDTKIDNRLMVPDTDRTKLMLVPQGAKKPKIFQLHTTLKDYIYTSSVKCFYPLPFQTGAGSVNTPFFE